MCAHQDHCLVNGETLECAHGVEGPENDADGEEGHLERSHRKIFECDVCYMKFSNGANMRRHKVFIIGKPLSGSICVSSGGAKTYVQISQNLMSTDLLHVQDIERS